MSPIPPDLARNIRGVHGERGTAWIEEFPALLDDIQRRWSLRVGPPYPALSYNYVAPAACADGSEAVLKLGVPNPEISCEAAALRHYDGAGAVRLLAADPERGALLIERAMPGEPLWDAADEEAIPVACAVMRSLWKPAPADSLFPTVDKWGIALHRAAGGPIPAAILNEAARVYADLCASSAQPVLLHGDLHHGNILAAAPSKHLAIDPKGVIGEPAYEVGAFMRNPMGLLDAAPELPARMSRRLSLFAELLELPRERLRAWSFAQAVLSACWTVEDGGADWAETLRVAEALRA
ncbi:MAG TPA: aminoglycoside phosphotransferase family protein [Armatimonadota bacterium]